jgi:hypoxanthine phosphoribosyltransferase
METVKVLDKTFYKTIPAEEIEIAIKKVAEQMNQELAGKDVIFLGILNGAFLFAADLFRLINFDCQISFLKVASYQGTSNSGKVKRLIGINEDVENKTVVILEDIIDTGITMDYILKQIRGYEPKEIKIATLLFKPEAFIKDFPIDYVAIKIPNDFIVGYGLDYDGYGRNLKDIYTLLPQ